MPSFTKLLCALPEDPLTHILEILPDSYSVFIKNLTLHIDCLDHVHLGGPGDLHYVILACHLGLIERIRYQTYHICEQTTYFGERSRGVHLLQREDFMYLRNRE